MDAPPECGLWDVKHRAYHADRTHVSHSALECFRESVPRYAAVYVTGEIAPEPTPEMRFGTAFHLWLLEPGRWGEEYAVFPKADRRTRDGKAAWERFLALAGAREVLAADDFDRICAMAAAVRNNPLAAELLKAPGKVEQAIVWRDEETGLRCKALVDKLLDGGVLLDVKSAADPLPRAWPRRAAGFGYHRQAPWYLDGAWRAAAADGPFVFLVVGKEPPHETVLYSPEEDALASGHADNREGLRDLADRRARGDWSSRYASVVQGLPLPPWERP